MMRPKKTPMRQCAGCGQMKPKKELVRLVRAPQKEEGQPPEVTLDLTGKKPGRGAYLCRDTQCLKQARKSRRLERAFSCKLPEEVYARLEEELQAQQQVQEQVQHTLRASRSKPSAPHHKKSQCQLLLLHPLQKE